MGGGGGVQHPLVKSILTFTIVFKTLLKINNLMVPKCEIFDRSDFPDFYTIKFSWVGDLVVEILTYHLNF
jgi:hypothetical protein